MNIQLFEFASFGFLANVIIVVRLDYLVNCLFLILPCDLACVLGPIY